MGVSGAGCYEGVPSFDAASESSSSDGDPTGADGGSDADTTEGNADDGGNEACEPTASPLRRMTNRQYIATLEALFPGHELDELAEILPMDASQHGFTSAAETQVPSDALIEGYQRGALMVTELALGDPQRAAATLGTAIPEDREQARQLATESLATLGPRVFRRPLGPGELDRYVALFDEQFATPTSSAPEDFVVALSVAVQALLQSPSFLYVFGTEPVDGPAGQIVPLSDYELASRLSYLVWGSMPDAELLDAAAAGELTDPGALEYQARRMLDAPAAIAALVGFHGEWLELDDLLDEMKDPATHPTWSDDVQASLHHQLAAYVELVMQDEGTITALMTHPQAPIDATLAAFMGLPAPSADWEPTTLPGPQRRGFLTLPGFLAAKAHPVHPSPVLRGVFIRERLLCLDLPEPPDDIDATPPDDPQAASTNRERYEQHVDDPECSGCHGVIDGLGFPFEQYDAIGMFRTTDAGQPVDASGEIVGTDVAGPVADAAELVDTLTSSTDLRRCVARQWFRHGFAHDVAQADTCTLDVLDAALAESGGDMRELLVAFVSTKAFTHRRLPHD